MNVFCCLRLGRLLPLVTLSLASLIVHQPLVHADTLSPQRIQELTDLGAQIADREKAMKEAEQQLQNPNLSAADRERLTNEVGDHRDFIKNTKDTIAAQGKDQKHVLDRAIEARQKQHQLKEAEAKAKADPNDKKAQRTANRLKVELQNDYKDLGTLPPLASAAMPDGGAEAFALADNECKKFIMLSSVGPAQEMPGSYSRLLTLYESAASASLDDQPEGSVLHPARFTGEAAIRSTRAHSALRLVGDPLESQTLGGMTLKPVTFAFAGSYQSLPMKGGSKATSSAALPVTPKFTVSLEATYENPESFVQDKRIDWTSIDCRKPVLAYGLTDKTFSIGHAWTRKELQISQSYYTHANVYGAADGSGDFGYFMGKQRIAVPQLATGIPDLPSTGSGTADISATTYPIPVGDVLLDTRYSFIKDLPNSTNAWKLSEDFLHEGLPGMDAWSPGFQTPWGTRMYTYSLDNLAQADQVARIAGGRINYIEQNVDAHGAPAGWLPSSWPRTDAPALPTFRIRREAR